MKKKILLSLGAMIAVVAGIAAMSAFEAHVINVTAHIENALSVDPHEIAFGTVFPQEYVQEELTVNLSSSFLTEGRVDDVNYVIKQKPKPIWPTDDVACIDKFGGDNADVDKARAYCHDHPEDFDCCYKDLCRFLSKLPKEEENGDVGIPSYYVDEDPAGPSADDHCRVVVDPEHATGYLTKLGGDESDTWIVDLKVPPVAGYVGQDWPATCADWVVPQNDQDYGCDLWVEITGISETPPYCGDGVVNGNEACESDTDCTAKPNGSCNLPGRVLECQCAYAVQPPIGP